MKNIKPILFYIPLLFLFYIFLLVISKGSITYSLSIFNDYFIYFNILFASIYLFLNENQSLWSIIILTLVALLLTIVSLEIIYPKTLKQNSNLQEKKILYYDEDFINEKLESNIEVPDDYLEKAEYYLNKGEYSSAFIYADYILETDNENIKALNIKNKSESNLKNLNNKLENPKYIETLKYKQLITQKNYLDAYYFCSKYDSNTLYDYDFSIKKNNCLELLLNSYYSINEVTEVLNFPGYSDIEFFYDNNGVKLYKIEKLVEFEDEYYIKNLTIENIIYPYIFINKEGKIFSNGFDENKKLIYHFPKPVIPMDNSNLKLFSKELYNFSSSSLYFNIKLYTAKNIKYFNDDVLAKLILIRISGYASILIIFFISAFIKKSRNYFDFLFLLTVCILLFKWYVTKIGLIIIVYGLSLSILFIILCYLLLLYIIIKKVNQQLSLF